MTAGSYVSREGQMPLQFTGELERAFQSRHYANVRGTLRLSSLLLATLALLYGGRDFLDTGSALFALRSVGPVIGFYLLVLALTFTNWFERIWQPILVIGGWLAATGALYALSAMMSGGPPGNAPPLPATVDTHQFSNIFFSLQTCLLMACLATFRPTFLWALALQVGVVGIGAWQIVSRVHSADTGHDLSRFLQATLLVLFAVLLAAYVQEGLARGAFYANYQLDLERSDERRIREKTEGMLRVLSQAIGGIVHDLGNPLTTVQLGASTLQHVVQSGEGAADPSIVATFAGHIESGALMLNFLRLSLIEQTRVLDGKPTPIRPAPVPLRRIVEAGVRYQKPRFAHGRKIAFDGDDIDVFADEMKLTTVFMNLIGNAFKYADGDICVAWRPSGEILQIAILDRGVEGVGITEAQAHSLFTPFGRLEAHMAIEGTGLGLLSVRNIVEAHGGHIYIEGYVDGVAGGLRYSTGVGEMVGAEGQAEPLLSEGFRTAFVLTCPYMQ